MLRLWTLGNLCRRRPRGTLESPPRPPVLISLGYLHYAPEAHSESWIRYLHSRGGHAETSQNIPVVVSESPRSINTSADLLARTASQSLRDVRGDSSTAI